MPSMHTNLTYLKYRRNAPPRTLSFRREIDLLFCNQEGHRQRLRRAGQARSLCGSGTRKWICTPWTRWTPSGRRLEDISVLSENSFWLEALIMKRFFIDSQPYRQNVAVEEVEWEKHKVHHCESRIQESESCQNFLSKSSKSLTGAFDERCQLYPGHLNLFERKTETWSVTQLIRKTSYQPWVQNNVSSSRD